MSGPLTGTRRLWSEVLSPQGAVSWRVLPTTLVFGLFATLVYLLYLYVFPNLTLEIGPHEIAGALLGLLLVLRTNTGYDRWWEARKLWGGIVNQARNLALIGLTHGPSDGRWREQFIRWTAAFAWAAKARLRRDSAAPELVLLLGEKEAARVHAAEHTALCVALQIDELLRQACRGENGMDRFAFLQAQRERAGLVDHLGGCERILSTPLAKVYSITIRRFILFYLATLPFALLHKFEREWMEPLVTVVIAHPVLVLDQLGVELQQPFDTRSINHLPLDDICRKIEKDLMGLLAMSDASAKRD
jgi:putative membrane protein